MHSQRIITTLVSTVCFIILAGCSTVQSRIEKRPALFNRLGEEQQDLIRDGKIAVGFSPEMVWLALGEPDRVEHITGEPKRDEVWEYIEYRDGSAGQLYTGMYHYWHYDPLYPYFLYYPEREAYARQRVSFNQNEVASFSTVEY